MKTAATLLQISKLLNLSPSTVSRALKNHPDISPGTRAKVLDLASKLDYEPNLNAVGLRTSQSREIAVLIPALSGFFYDSFISAVEEEARGSGLSTIILLSGDDPLVEEENLKICKQRRVRGVLACLCAGTTSVEPFLRLKNVEIPVVFFDKVPRDAGAITVRVGDEEAAATAANHLISKGKRNTLALFGDPKMSITIRRITAFESAYSAIPEKELYRIEYVTSSDMAEQIVLKALASPQRPDAVFCMSDEILIGVMKAVQKERIQYPSQLGIIAISNGFFPKLYSPEITYVETSGFELGKLALHRLVEEFSEGIHGADIALPSPLIAGESL